MTNYHFSDKSFVKDYDPFEVKGSMSLEQLPKCTLSKCINCEMLFDRLGRQKQAKYCSSVCSDEARSKSQHSREKEKNEQVLYMR